VRRGGSTVRRGRDGVEGGTPWDLALVTSGEVVEDGEDNSWMDLAGHIPRGTVDEEALPFKTRSVSAYTIGMAYWGGEVLKW